MNRPLRLVAPLLAVLVAAGCGTFEQEPAAVVNDEEITDEAVQDELDDAEASEAYRTFLEEQFGRTFAGSGSGTVATPFVSALLTERVYLALIEQDLGSGLSQERIDEAAARLEAEGGEQLAELPREQRDALARRVALLTALQEERVPEYYEDNVEDFDTLCVRHVLVSTEERSEGEALERAEELAGRLDDGTAFRRLARTESDDEAAAEEGGDLGCFIPGGGQFVAEFEEGAAELEEGEVSEPVLTEFGYHLIQVRERTRSGLEEVDDAVQQRLIAELARTAEVDVDERYGRWDERDGGYQVVPPREGGGA